MYICFAVIGIIGFFICKKKECREWQKSFLVCIVVGVLAFGASISEQGNVVLEDGNLMRRPIGEGEYEAELILEVEEQAERSFRVNVPEQLMTKEEEMQCLWDAVNEVEEELKDESSSGQKISGQLKIRETYQKDRVKAEWNFSNPDLVRMDGTINEDALTVDGEELYVTVTLTCGNSKLLHTMVLTIYCKEKSEQEILDEKIQTIILEKGKESGMEILELPKEVDGRSLVWRIKKSPLPQQIFGLGMIVACLLPELEREKQREQKKRRAEQLLQEYPEMINKLTLLLGAGMTVQAAWNRITDMYITARKEGKISRKEVYEEMLITRHEIESGRGEIRSYEAFGERCGLPRFRKFSNYLVQNIKKGSLGICDLLEREAMEIFIERKNRARRSGEEATTKLLLPMFLMLGIVIFIIMVPAIMSFQMGT